MKRRDFLAGILATAVVPPALAAAVLEPPIEHLFAFNVDGDGVTFNGYRLFMMKQISEAYGIPRQVLSSDFVPGREYVVHFDYLPT